jgi:hypothetical protein
VGTGAGVIPRFLRGTEEKIGSLPLLGDVTRNAERASIESFNLNKINDALGDLGKVTTPGLEGLARADELISKTYDSVLPHISIDPQKADAATINAFFKNQQQALFDEGHAGKFSQFIERRIQPLIDRGESITGETAKKLDAEIGELARKYSASGVGNEPLGKAFFDLRKEWRGAMEGATPEARSTLQKADKAFAKLLPLEQAGQKSSVGMFTPKQVSDALRRLGQDKDPLTEAARRVLPASIPDSGTAGRQILANLLHPAGVGAATAGATTALGGFGPLAAAALGAGALYTKPGLKMVAEGPSHMIARALRGGRYDPESLEQLVRNIAGRSATAVAPEISE